MSLHCHNCQQVIHIDPTIGLITDDKDNDYCTYKCKYEQLHKDLFERNEKLEKLAKAIQTWHNKMVEMNKLEDIPESDNPLIEASRSALGFYYPDTELVEALEQFNSEK